MRNSKEVRALVAAAAACAAAAAPVSAWAYGVELPENGAVAFGRGGAFLTRASDPSALMHDVAGIMGLQGFQITLSSNVGVANHCFQRSGVYDGPASGATVNVDGTVFDPMSTGDAPYINGRTPYPEVCNDTSIALAPMLLGTYRINRWIAVGAGVFAPSTTGSTQHFGGPDGVAGHPTVTARDPMTGMTYMAPSPARSLLYQKDLVVLHPVVAVAVQPLNWLRVGLGIEPSIGNFQFGLNANANNAAPQSPSSDVYIHLNATGFFMAGSLSVQALPLPFLSFAAQFHYNFPVDGSGTADATASPYAATAAGRIASQFTIDSMRVQLPWTLRAGARYNLPRAGRPQQNDGTGRYDPMTDDVFDVEAVFTYENTSDLSETGLTNHGNIKIDAAGTAVAAPHEITIRSALSNTYGVRLGGDWNVLPGTLAVRAGFSYETGAVSGQLAQIHLPAYADVSLHAGLSYRWRWLTVSASYGHFFFQNNDATTGVRAVTVPDPQINTSNTGCAQGTPATVGPGACTVNRGVYSASFDSAALQLTARF